MNIEAYNAVRRDEGGAGVMIWQRSWLRVTGRDRQSFLNGQLSADILYLRPSQGVHACLLNNTGHLLANLYAHATEDSILMELNPARSKVAVDTLSRYMIREKVHIEDESENLVTIMVQGRGSRAILSSALDGGALPDIALLPLSNAPVTVMEGFKASVFQHQHASTTSGWDITVPTEIGEEVYRALLRAPGAKPMDWPSYEVMRIEAGIPRWGAELDETIIPIEANLYSAINQNKGCYMGQEVIARILSRGHTNRSLVGLSLSGPAEAGSPIMIEAGEESRRNQDVGRLTSFANSPDAGLIGLGYVRNEHARLGAALHVGAARAAVTALPFVS